MEPISGIKVLRASNKEFQTPDVIRVKPATMDQNALSPIRNRNLLQTQDLGDTIFSGKTDDADFERDENPETIQKLDISLSHDISEVCTVQEIDNNTANWEEITVLKSCAMKLAQKLKEAQKEIENLKTEKLLQEEKHKAKIKEMEKERTKTEKVNKNLNKKLLNAIVAIKQTLWSNVFINEESDSQIYSLQLENMNLRNFLKLQKKYDIDAEEMLLKAKESYIRSKSLKVKNKEQVFPSQLKFKCPSKEGQAARALIKNSIRKVRRRSRRKRSESFDCSIFLPQTRLDIESDSDSSSQDYDGYEFDELDSNNDFKVKALPKTEIKSIIDVASQEDNGGKAKKKDEYSFGFSGSYSMKVKDEGSS